MRDGGANLRAIFSSVVAIAFCAACPAASEAQWAGREGSTTSGPSLEDYVKDVGPEAQVIPQGKLKIDGISVRVRLPRSDERSGPRDQVVAVERVRLVAHAHGWRPHSDTATPDGQGDSVTVSPAAP